MKKIALYIPVYKERLKVYLVILWTTFALVLYQQCSPVGASSSNEKGIVVQAVPVIPGGGDGADDGTEPEEPPVEECMPVVDQDCIDRVPPTQIFCKSGKTVKTKFAYDDDEGEVFVDREPASMALDTNPSGSQLCRHYLPKPTKNCRKDSEGLDYEVVPCVPVCHTPPGNPSVKRTMYKPVGFVQQLADGKVQGGFTLGRCDCEPESPAPSCH